MPAGQSATVCRGRQSFWRLFRDGSVRVAVFSGRTAQRRASVLEQLLRMPVSPATTAGAPRNDPSGVVPVTAGLIREGHRTRTTRAGPAACATPWRVARAEMRHHRAWDPSIAMRRAWPHGWLAATCKPRGIPRTSGGGNTEQAVWARTPGKDEGGGCGSGCTLERCRAGRARSLGDVSQLVGRGAREAHLLDIVHASLCGFRRLLTRIEPAATCGICPACACCRKLRISTRSIS